jgi:hypothetical protein
MTDLAWHASLETERPVAADSLLGFDLEACLGQEAFRLRDGDADPRGYKHVWRLFANVSRDLGVQVTVSDAFYWRTILGISRGLDDIVDDHDVHDLASQLGTLARGLPVGGIQPTEAHAFRTCLSLQPEDRRVLLLGEGGLAHASVHAKARAAALTPCELVEVNRAEARWYASLLELPIVGRPDDASRRRFNRWVLTFCVSGYAFDGANDMVKDYARAQIQVRPRFFARARLVTTALKELAVGAVRTPKCRLGQLAYIAFRNRYPVRTHKRVPAGRRRAEIEDAVHYAIPLEMFVASHPEAADLGRRSRSQLSRLSELGQPHPQD